MQQGTANDKQTKLNFAKKISHTDNPSKPNGTNATSTPDGNRAKRNRIEFENPIDFEGTYYSFCNCSL